MSYCLDLCSLDKLRCSCQQEEHLRRLMRQSTTVHNNYKVSWIPRENVLRRLDDIMNDISLTIQRGEAPTMSFTSIYKANIRLGIDGLELCPNTHSNKTVTLILDQPNASTTRSFKVHYYILEKIHALVRRNVRSTNRDIYYSDVSFFQSQGVVNRAVNNITSLVRVPRCCLHCDATQSGAMAGPILLELGNISSTYMIDCMNCSTNGIAIPSNPDELIDVKSMGAMFVLIVEKDAVFVQLLSEGSHRMIPCVIITGRGYPDIATRRMVRILWDTLQLPTFLLVDADPFGYEIALTYKVGSKSLINENHRLAVPSARLLGILWSDISHGAPYHLNESCYLTFDTYDIAKANKMISRNYIPTSWRIQLDNMIAIGAKAEIEAVNSTYGSAFLSHVYLPHKLQQGSWLDNHINTSTPRTTIIHTDTECISMDDELHEILDDMMIDRSTLEEVTATATTTATTTAKHNKLDHMNQELHSIISNQQHILKKKEDHGDDGMLQLLNKRFEE